MKRNTERWAGPPAQILREATPALELWTEMGRESGHASSIDNSLIGCDNYGKGRPDG
jgi:hypothetical protein